MERPTHTHLRDQPKVVRAFDNVEIEDLSAIKHPQIDCFARLAPKGFKNRAADLANRRLVSTAGAEVNEVQAGFVEADAADLQSASPQRRQTDRRSDWIGVQYRLRAVSRVLFHHKIGKHEARPGKDAKFDRG